MDILDNCAVIKFAPNQQPPKGYLIVFSHDSEYYHWVNTETGEESNMICSRWLARRAAFNRERELKEC